VMLPFGGLAPLKHAGGVALNDIAGLELARHRLPAGCKALVQDLVGARLVVPDRDRLDRTESGGAIDEPPVSG
jgi:hypothetical protein